MRKNLTSVLVLLAVAACSCQAGNVVTKMFPENGAKEVNIDTHLILTMAEEAQDMAAGVCDGL